MKKLIGIILGIILLICSFSLIPNSSIASDYNAPEILQNRIDYSLKVIWNLQGKYKSSNFNQLMLRMNPRDRQMYLSALRVYNKAKMEFSTYIIKTLQYKYNTSNYNLLMSRMNPIDKRIFDSALQDYQKAKNAYNFLLQNKW